MFDRQLFANRFKKLREDKKLSQKECAEQLGISRGSISFYENGDRLPDIESIFAISSFFKVSADYLIGLSHTKSPNIDVQFVCKYTGLTEDALKTIQSYHLSQIDAQKNISNFLDKGEKAYTLADRVMYNINNFIESDAFEKIIHAFTAENLNDYYFNTIEKKDIKLLSDEELEQLHFIFDTKLDRTKANLYDIQAAVVNYYATIASENISNIQDYVEELKQEISNRMI